MSAPGTLLCGSDDEIPKVDPSAFVHPLAHVTESEVGARTKIWQFASVTRGTVLGSDCNVAPFAVLDGPKFGNRCIVSMHVAMGPGFQIGNEVFIGPGVVFANDAWPSVSKDGFDAEALRSGKLVTIRVRDGASIGAKAVILPGVTVGMNAVIAAGAVVDRDVPTGMLFRRDGQIVPARSFFERRRMRAVKGC